MALVLGTVAFLDHELPPSVNFGGSQAHRLHRYPNGKRVIDVMGPDDADIKWSGEFQGFTAQIRARMVDLKRRAGKPMTLTWGTFVYKVIIGSFEADYEAPFRIPYRISCVVISDKIADKVGPIMERIENFVSDTISDAIGISADDPELGGIVAGAQTAVQTFATSGRFDGATLMSSAGAGLASGLSNSVDAVSEQASNWGTQLTSGGGLAASAVPGANPETLAASVGNLTTASEGAYRSESVNNLLTNLRDRVSAP